MTSDIYSTIGPFKGVPEEDRARLAHSVSEAAEAVYDAASRQLRETADNADGSDVYLPSVAVVNTGWQWIDRSNDDQIKDLRAIYIMFAMVSVAIFITGLGFSVAHFRMTGLTSQLFVGVAFTLFFNVILSLMAYFSTSDTRQVVSDIRKHGYFDGAVKHLTRRASKCWIVGNKALHIAEKHVDTTRAKSVFFDAIGHVAVTIDGGHDKITVYSRDGSSIADLHPSKANGETEALAQLLRDLSANPRAA
jgi:hypothetical protein